MNKKAFLVSIEILFKNGGNGFVPAVHVSSSKGQCIRFFHDAIKNGDQGKLIKDVNVVVEEMSIEFLEGLIKTIKGD